MAQGRANNSGGYRPFRCDDEPTLVALKLQIPNILSFNTASNISDLLEDIKKFAASDMGQSLTTSQLRNIFSKIKPVKTSLQLQLIRPQLAYVAARQGKPDAKCFVEFFEEVIAKVKEPDQVKNFVSFFEAVVAYHKYYEKKRG